MDKKKLGSGIGIGAAIALTGALAFGGYTVFHGVGQSATAEVPAYSGPVASSVAAPAQDEATAQSIYDQQIAQAKADADATAAAQVAAQQAAAQAAAPKKVAAVSGPVKCPAGSTVQGYDDNNNATACIPDICMNGIGGPGQPTNEQCVVFKP